MSKVMGSYVSAAELSPVVGDVDVTPPGAKRQKMASPKKPKRWSASRRHIRRSSGAASSGVRSSASSSSTKSSASASKSTWYVHTPGTPAGDEDLDLYWEALANAPSCAHRNSSESSDSSAEAAGGADPDFIDVDDTASVSINLDEDFDLYADLDLDSFWEELAGKENKARPVHDGPDHNPPAPPDVTAEANKENVPPAPEKVELKPHVSFLSKSSVLGLKSFLPQMLLWNKIIFSAMQKCKKIEFVGSGCFVFNIQATGYCRSNDLAFHS